jgi:hypothetical protein
MNPTDEQIQAALDAWSVPELSEELSTRTLTRARATLGAEKPDGVRGSARLSLVVTACVPALLGMAAAGVVADTWVKIQKILGG